MNCRKIFVQTTKWSASPKIPDFQNGGKSPLDPFLYVGSKFKCLQLVYRLKGKDIFSAIYRKPEGIFLKSVDFFCQKLSRYEKMT